jgi:hypothetical protein
MRQLIVVIVSVLSACWTSPKSAHVAAPAPAAATTAAHVKTSPTTLLAAVTRGTASLATAIDPHDGVMHIVYAQMAYVDNALPIEEHLCGDAARALARSIDVELKERVHQNDTASDFARCEQASAGTVACRWGDVGEGSPSVRLDFVEAANGWRLVRIVALDSVGTESWEREQSQMLAAAMQRLGGKTCR